ncbi:hypothetical protein OTK51_08920 [Vibrio scophthalmi]|nr:MULTISPECIES: hypothetical protein [Vibrio]MCY9803556.1 hypothetical protein [Vibrio scophthalmi]
MGKMSEECQKKHHYRPLNGNGAQQTSQQTTPSGKSMEGTLLLVVC